jgi:predicted nucleotidyltransferase component of viral defense system
VALVMDKTEILSEKMRAIMSPKRKHKERDLYDIYNLLGKKTTIDKKLISIKLKESKITFSNTALEKNIDDIKSTWKNLEPFMQHKLENYDYVKEFVKEDLKKQKVL